MKALVLGGTGLVGREVVRLLNESENFSQIDALVRREPAFNECAKVNTLLMNHADPATSLEGVEADVVFCALGTTQKAAGSKEAFYQVDHDLVLSLAQAAHKQGVKRFIVVSALGAQASSAIYYNRIKGQVESKLKAIGFESLVLIRPSLLLGSRDEVRIGEDLGKIAFKFLGCFMFGPLKRYLPIEAKSVAWNMVQASCRTFDEKVTEMDNLELILRYDEAHA